MGGKTVRYLNRMLTSFTREDTGAALAEWGLLVVLIAIVALVGVAAAGNELSSTYSEITSTLAGT